MNEDKEERYNEQGATLAKEDGYYPTHEQIRKATIGRQMRVLENYQISKVFSGQCDTESGLLGCC